MRSAFASLDPVWKLIQVWNLHRGNFPPVKNLIFFLQLRINHLICDLIKAIWTDLRNVFKSFKADRLHRCSKKCWRRVVAKFETKAMVAMLFVNPEIRRFFWKTGESEADLSLGWFELNLHIIETQPPSSSTVPTFEVFRALSSDDLVTKSSGILAKDELQRVHHKIN